VVPIRLERGEPAYPPGLADCLGEEAPPVLWSLGNLEVLQRRKLAMLCSVRCPGSAILQSYDLAHRLRQGSLAVAGGFHSPMEQEWLKVLLLGPQPTLLCLARGLEGMRLPSEYREPLQEGRLLLLSGFEPEERRVTAETALARNRLVAALADALFVAHAEPGGKTEKLCHQVLAWGKPLFTLEGGHNRDLLGLGARALAMGELVRQAEALL
jgi:predicted Rossmann fold nucleotide-binding protein DprA/Smf involved in DNA uptake